MKRPGLRCQPAHTMIAVRSWGDWYHSFVEHSMNKLRTNYSLGMYATTLEFPHSGKLDDRVFRAFFIVQAIMQPVAGSEPIVFTYSLN